MDPVSHSIEQRVALVFGPPGCYSLGVCMQFGWWGVGGGGVTVTLRGLVRAVLSSPDQSTTVMPAPPGSSEIY